MNLILYNKVDASIYSDLIYYLNMFINNLYKVNRNLNIFANE